jgi:hypothetical protein
MNLKKCKKTFFILFYFPFFILFYFPFFILFYFPFFILFYFPFFIPFYFPFFIPFYLFASGCATLIKVTLEDTPHLLLEADI